MQSGPKVPPTRSVSIMAQRTPATHRRQAVAGGILLSVGPAN